MGCIESTNYEILQSNCSFKECRDYLKKNFREIYEVEPGYKIFDTHIIGVPPITLAVEGDDVIFPYTKPCHGTFVLRAKDKSEVERLRARR